MPSAKVVLTGDAMRKEHRMEHRYSHQKYSHGASHRQERRHRRDRREEAPRRECGGDRGEYSRGRGGRRRHDSTVRTQASESWKSAFRRTKIAVTVWSHDMVRALCRPLGRFAAVLAIAAILGLVIGIVLPRVSEPVRRATGGTVAFGEAADLARGLTVAEPHASASYDRDLFAFRSTDPDGNGCDVREDVLARDLTDVVFDADGCTVRSGTLADPYTGQEVRFRRGKSTSSAVQIDHVVALRNAWISGADAWELSRRIAFANDPGVLLAVQGQANQEKSDASADHWLPPNEGFRCDYVAMQVSIKHTWGLSVTRTERTAMLETLASCPGQNAAMAGVTGGFAGASVGATCAHVMPMRGHRRVEGARLCTFGAG